MRRPIQPWAFMIGAGVGLVAGSVLTSQLIARDGELKACRVRVENVQISDGGSISLRCSLIATSSATIQFASGVPGASRISTEFTDPWFGPRRGSFIHEFDVDESLNLDREALVAGLQVESGHEYELTPLNPLEIFRVETGDDVRSERIEIR